MRSAQSRHGGRRPSRSSTSAPTASSASTRTRACKKPSSTASSAGARTTALRGPLPASAQREAEEKLAAWLGTEAALIYPSVTLANMGAIPGLVGRQDLLVVDEQAHNSIQEGAKIARANGVRVLTFSHCDPVGLETGLRARPATIACAVVAIDGVYSMSGELPPLAELNEVCLRHNAVLYVDDAHGTGVLGTQGRGTVLDALGNYDNTLVDRLAVQGLLLPGRLHRLHRGVQAAAEDALRTPTSSAARCRRPIWKRSAPSATS